MYIVSFFSFFYALSIPTKWPLTILVGQVYSVGIAEASIEKEKFCAF